MAFTALLVLFRALCVFFGATAAAHWLGMRVNEELIGDSDAERSYLGWLGDSLAPDSTVTEAVGNSLLLGAAGIVLGLIVGGILGGLLRVPRLGTVLGFLAIPSLAVFIPGIVLFPVAQLALDQNLIPAQALGDGQPVSETLRFIGFWGLLVGLAIAPVIAAVTAGRGRPRLFGLSTIEAPLAARTEPAPTWRFGLPLSVFGLAMASAEVLSGHDGVLGRFYRSLATGELATALDLAVVVILAAAFAAVFVDLLGLADRSSRSRLHADSRHESDSSLESDSPPGSKSVLQPEPELPINLDPAAPGPIRVSKALPYLFVVLVAVAGIAGAGLAGYENARTVSERTAASLAGAATAALVPGLVAMIIGLLVAALRKVAPTSIERVLGTLIDTFWWPLPVMVPLVALFSQIGLGVEQQAVALGLTGAMIAPSASRLIGRSVLSASTSRTLRFVAAWLYCSSLALAAYLIAGFMGFVDDNPIDSLGLLIMEGIEVYSQDRGALLIPSVAAVVLLGLMQGLAAAVTVPSTVSFGAAKIGAGDDLTEPQRTRILEGAAPLGDDSNSDSNSDSDAVPDSDADLETAGASEPTQILETPQAPDSEQTPDLDIDIEPAAPVAESPAPVTEPVAEPPAPVTESAIAAEPGDTAPPMPPTLPTAAGVTIAPATTTPAIAEPVISEQPPMVTKPPEPDSAFAIAPPEHPSRGSADAAVDDTTSDNDKASDDDKAGVDASAESPASKKNPILEPETVPEPEAAQEPEASAESEGNLESETDERIDIEAEASRTIELRPSTVRKVQAQAADDQQQQDVLAAEQEAEDAAEPPAEEETKPVLASRRSRTRFGSRGSGSRRGGAKR